MAENKKSIWSLIILVSTIISLVLLIVAVVLLAIGAPAVLETGKQAAIDAGASADEAAVIATGVLIGVIVVFVLSSIFDILKIIGGFMFSLKGRWGIFCIVVSILSAVGAIGTLISDISNKAAVGSIIVSALNLAVSALLVVACFKHKLELAK